MFTLFFRLAVLGLLWTMNEMEEILVSLEFSFTSIGLELMGRCHFLIQVFTGP